MTSSLFAVVEVKVHIFAPFAVLEVMTTCMCVWDD